MYRGGLQCLLHPTSSLTSWWLRPLPAHPTDSTSNPTSPKLTSHHETKTHLTSPLPSPYHNPHNNTMASQFGMRAAQQAFRQSAFNLRTLTQRRLASTAPPSPAAGTNAQVVRDAAVEQKGFAKLWNSPVGPKTVHFWAPIMKVCSYRKLPSQCLFPLTIHSF